MTNDFVQAVGVKEMRFMFEHDSNVISVNDNFAVVVETSGPRENKITTAIDMAIDKGYTVAVDASAVMSAELGHDVTPKYETALMMLSAIKDDLEKDLRSENDEISPT